MGIMRKDGADIWDTRDMFIQGREFHNGTNAPNIRSVLQEDWGWILY